MMCAPWATAWVDQRTGAVSSNRRLPTPWYSDWRANAGESLPSRAIHSEGASMSKTTAYH